jgi:hypothetical protein
MSDVVPIVDAAEKRFGPAAPLFDPTTGDVVLEPEGQGGGYWVGAPSALWDRQAKCWWLTYRRRRPRGVNPDNKGERGYVARVARSDDGLAFEDVWEIYQGELGTTSMERFCVARAADGSYRLYTSYVDPSDNRWRIDVLGADRPDRFDARQARSVFTAASATAEAREPVEGVKDPYVFRSGDTWYMFISYAAAVARSDDERARMHATADVYNTGLTTAPTALATSADGFSWSWQGRILDVGSGEAWDRYQSRLNSATSLGGLWLGFYDGAASVAENTRNAAGSRCRSTCAGGRSSRRRGRPSSRRTAPDQFVTSRACSEMDCSTATTNTFDRTAPTSCAAR